NQLRRENSGTDQRATRHRRAQSRYSLLSTASGGKHRNQGKDVGRDHCPNRGDSKKRRTRRRCHSEGNFGGKRRHVFRSACDRPGRSYTGRTVAGTQTGRRVHSRERFFGGRPATFARDVTAIFSMQRLHPRSPYEKLGGYVHLPRLIDKAKLHREGLLNGYNYKTVG